MSVDVEQLLAAVSGDSPCGEDLEYDAAFLELNRAAAGRPAQTMGDQTIPAEEPDWADVQQRCTALFSRTKDLRIAILMARALIRTDGLPGFADALAVTRGLVERYWERVHPQLDPTDDNDPTTRVNTLAGLANRDQTIAALRVVPLANSRRMGRYSLRDIEIATGALPRPEGEATTDLATIEAAFLDTDAAELEARAVGVKAALDHMTTLDASLAAAVGAASSADFSLLRTTLKSMSALLQQQLGRRGLSAGGDGQDATAAAAAATGAPTMSGPIQSREDVIRTLDQVIDWYARHEPSSPVPLLLGRAKRLVSKNFLEAVQDLTPSGVTELQTIAGSESSS